MHDSSPPRVDEILAVLAAHRVDYVLAGSVAARFHGVEPEPGDLDIVPALDPANLQRLVLVLDALEARPLGPFGAWTTRADGEQAWVGLPTTDEDLMAWTPDVCDLTTLDQLYGSRLGNLDVVPSLAGTYDVLRERAVCMEAHEHRPWVAHIDDLLARLTVPRREKDGPRVAQLRRIQRTSGRRGA